MLLILFQQCTQGQGQNQKIYQSQLEIYKLKDQTKAQSPSLTANETKKNGGENIHSILFNLFAEKNLVAKGFWQSKDDKIILKRL